MVRSRAWRQGYESYRKGEAPDFAGRGRRALAYEYGRLTAALLSSEGQSLHRVSAARPVNPHHLPGLVRALRRAAVGRLTPRPTPAPAPAPAPA